MHSSTRTNSAVWPVPYACAQPYHPGSGSHGQLFRPYWSSSTWLGRRVNGRGKNPRIKDFWVHGSIFSSHLHKHAVGEPFCGSQPTDTTCFRWSWRLMKCFALDSAVKGLKCDPTATPCWWAPTMVKPLSVAATAWVIWLCTCTRCWYVCFSDWYWEDNPVWQTGLPTSVGHQTYHVNVIKLKWEDYMDRGVTPPKRVTSSTRGPPPPCKQALNLLVRSLSAKYRPDRYRRDKSVKFGTELP